MEGGMPRARSAAAAAAPRSALRGPVAAAPSYHLTSRARRPRRHGDGDNKRTCAEKGGDGAGRDGSGERTERAAAPPRAPRDAGAAVTRERRGGTRGHTRRGCPRAAGAPAPAAGRELPSGIVGKGGREVGRSIPSGRRGALPVRLPPSLASYYYFSFSLVFR